MKILWLCSYPLYLLNDYFEKPLNYRKFHPATWMYNLMTEVNKRNHELHVVTTCPYFSSDKIVKTGNVTFHILTRGVPFINKGFPDYLRIDAHTNYWFLKHKIHKIIEKVAPDVVNAHGTEDLNALSTINIGIPSITWIQGFISDILASNPKNSFLVKQAKLEQKVFINTDNFISNCDYFDKKITSLNAKAKIHYLSYPISSQAFDLPEADPTADICFVGNIIKRKGVEDLIDATSIVKKIKNNIKVKIIGTQLSPEYEVFLNAKIDSLNLKDNIRFIGHLVDHLDVLKEVKASRVFVLPTHADTGPRSIAESMALKIPVVSYKIDGVPWMLGQQNERGMTVELGNIDALAESILSVLNSEELSGYLTLNAFSFAKTYFHVEPVVDNLLNIYTKIL